MTRVWGGPRESDKQNAGHLGALGATSRAQTRHSCISLGITGLPPYLSPTVSAQIGPMPWTIESAFVSRRPHQRYVAWRGRHSWTAELRDTSGDSRHIGRTVTYDGATLTIDDPLSGVDTFSAGGTDSVGVVPEKWLIPHEFSTSNGWRALGVGTDGYEQFEKTEDIAGKQITALYKRDPVSGIVMGFTESVDGRQVTTVEVTSLEALPASDAASEQDPEAPPNDPEPQPTSTAE